MIHHLACKGGLRNAEQDFNKTTTERAFLVLNHSHEIPAMNNHPNNNSLGHVTLNCLQSSQIIFLAEGWVGTQQLTVFPSLSSGAVQRTFWSLCAAPFQPCTCRVCRAKALQNICMEKLNWQPDSFTFIWRHLKTLSQLLKDHLNYLQMYKFKAPEI